MNFGPDEQHLQGNPHAPAAQGFGDHPVSQRDRLLPILRQIAWLGLVQHKLQMRDESSSSGCSSDPCRELESCCSTASAETGLSCAR